MTKQKFNDLSSNIMVKCWQSGKNFYLTMLDVAAAGPQIWSLIMKKFSKIGKKCKFFMGHITVELQWLEH